MPDELTIDFTRDEMLARLRMDPSFAKRLWSAFGFASDPTTGDAGNDEAFGFSERDLAALGIFVGSDREMDPSAQLAAARSIGQALARLAEWEAEQIQALSDVEDLPLTTDELVDAVAHLHDLIWRRHLHGFLARASSPDAEHGEVIVGFADIVGYTSLSRRLGLAELEELLETFESAAHSIINSHGGQVIKSLGDAVMFTSPTAAAAAEMALELHALTSDGRLPQLRIGMAAGTALVRMGDVFGEPVNIASRLAGAARAGTTLVDEQLTEALHDDPDFHLKHLSTLSVRGYRRLKAHALQAAAEAGRDKAHAERRTRRPRDKRSSR